uniref:Uncharacterized protein n=1 Tax=Leptobrachium leishanense TaxID=445787 RepID=A0A8C5PPL2_9ANUR
LMIEAQSSSEHPKASLQLPTHYASIPGGKSSGGTKEIQFLHYFLKERSSPLSHTLRSCNYLQIISFLIESPGIYSIESRQFAKSWRIACTYENTNQQ